MSVCVCVFDLLYVLYMLVFMHVRLYQFLFVCMPHHRSCGSLCVCACVCVRLCVCVCDPCQRDHKISGQPLRRGSDAYAGVTRGGSCSAGARGAGSIARHPSHDTTPCHSPPRSLLWQPASELTSACGDGDGGAESAPACQDKR